MVLAIRYEAAHAENDVWNIDRGTMRWAHYWSEGMVGQKTLQQITEEFAEIVIPKVWLRED
jgi:hypothetical protein